MWYNIEHIYSIIYNYYYQVNNVTPKMVTVGIIQEGRDGYGF